MKLNNNLVNIIWIVAFAIAIVFIGITTFGMYSYHKSNSSQDLALDISQQFLVLNNDQLQAELKSIDSLSNAIIEIKFLDSAKLELNKSIRTMDSINRVNHRLFTRKVDSLNIMIDNYNDRISNLSEVEGDYTFKANFFYSIIIFIITLFAFFGYRNLTTLKETARQEAKDEARLVSKAVLTDDVKIEIERILRDGDAANNFFADLENQMKSSLKEEMEEFEKKYPINDAGEKQLQIENEINWLKDQIKSLIKKINEQ